MYWAKALALLFVTDVAGAGAAIGVRAVCGGVVATAAAASSAAWADAL